MCRNAFIHDCLFLWFCLFALLFCWNRKCLPLRLLIFHLLVCLLEQKELQWSTYCSWASVCNLVGTTLFFKTFLFEIACVCLYIWLCVKLVFVDWSNRNCNGVHMFHEQMYANSYVPLFFKVHIIVIISVCLYFCLLLFCCLRTGAIGIVMEYIFVIGKCV